MPTFAVPQLQADMILPLLSPALTVALLGAIESLMSANCHFRIGHDPDGPDGPRGPNWKLSNPNVRRDAQRRRDSLELAP